MNRKIKITILLLLSLLAAAEIRLTAAGGREQSANTKYIGTPQELLEFSREVNAGNSHEGCHVILTADLDMSRIADFVPIGEWGGDHLFRGIFDGNGYTISNLTIRGDEEANLGLFGSLGGIVCNLTLDDCSLSGNACGAFCSIAGSSDAAIVNCAVRGADIDADYTDVIGGQYLGRKQNCVVDGQGDVESLNAELRDIWRLLDMIPVNRWTQGENGVELSKEKEAFPSSIYITLEDSYDGKILPVLYQEEDCDVFCLPGMSEGKNAAVVLEFPDGSLKREKIKLPDEKELSVENGGESYRISLRLSENTGAVFLDTGREDGLDYLRSSRDNVLSGIVRVLDENGELQYAGRAERIHGRGNDSWFAADKQGFGFKLQKSGSILGMGSADNYALVAGYRNASLLTYQMIRDLCRELEWKNVPEYRMVQLYFDGEYWGLYFLSEKLEAGPNRIPLSERGDESGGFVFEYAMEDYKERDIRIVTERENSLVVVSPTLPSKSQLSYCQQFMKEMEEALYSETGVNEFGRHYTEYIDLESWAAQWLINEAMGEVSTENSVYFYKDADGTAGEKLHGLPPWDVEHSCVFLKKDGIMEFPRNSWWNAAAGHADFRAEVQRQWEEKLLPALEKLLQEEAVWNPEGVSSLRYYVEQLEAASDLNELRWGEEQDMGEKEKEIRRFMSVTIPWLQEKLYQAAYYE